MARSEQKLKLFYLIKILNENTDDKHFLSMAEIIDKLRLYDIEAERKSIYDDFESLRKVGINVEYVHRHGYHIETPAFELAELKLLVDAVQSSKFITEKKSSSLIKKLEGLTSIHKANELQHTVIMQDRIKTMDESIYKSVDTIHDAISGGKQITYKYFDWDMHKNKNYRHNGKLYRVSPVSLVWDNQNYYLIAYDGEAGKLKHYRVDKMERIMRTDLKCENVQKDGKRFDVAGYSKKVFGMYGGEETNIVLRCAPETAGAVIDKFGIGAFISPCGDYFELNAKVQVSPLFFACVFEFGGKIKIEKPESVKKQFAEMMTSVGRDYSPPEI